MNTYLPKGAIYVKDVNLWAHVGVLDQERLLGQSFKLDFILCMNLDEAAIKDDLMATADYSIAITEVQKLAFETECFTIEHFSELILDLLEKLYGSIPMRVDLKKCSAPVFGFTGSVEVQRTRYWGKSV